jgi:hypothetical protein
MRKIVAATTCFGVETGILVDPLAKANGSRRTEGLAPPHAHLSGRLPVPATIRSGSYFEQMALGCSATISGARLAVLGLLLGATLRLPVGMGAVLRPIWADEAIQRAYDMVHLVAALDRAVPYANANSKLLTEEHRIAAELAAAYRSLNFAHDTSTAPCSEILRTAIHDLVQLFGPAVGSPHLRIAIESLTLPMFQRRALVLAASRLVTDAFCRSERLTDLAVTLARIGPHTARLRVVGADSSTCDPDDTVSDLASLLESEPVYAIDDAGRTTVDITFPTRDTGSKVCRTPATDRPTASNNKAPKPPLTGDRQCTSG